MLSESDNAPPKIDLSSFTTADGLVVSTKDRIIKDVPAPAVSIPTDEQFWSDRPGLPDIAFLKDHFYREGRLSETQALYILEKGRDILKSEPNLLQVGAPVTGIVFFFFFFFFFLKIKKFVILF
jgi:serine/threonine-protein phosphatase 2B catalytic subunit